jgi:hypothetical protein
MIMALFTVLNLPVNLNQVRLLSELAQPGPAAVALPGNLIMLPASRRVSERPPWLGP